MWSNGTGVTIAETYNSCRGNRREEEKKEGRNGEGGKEGGREGRMKATLRRERWRPGGWKKGEGDVGVVIIGMLK